MSSCLLPVLAPPLRTRRAQRKPGSRLSFPDRQGTDLVVVGEFNPDVLVLGDDVTPSFGQQESWWRASGWPGSGVASSMAAGADDRRPPPGGQVHADQGVRGAAPG